MGYLEVRGGRPKFLVGTAVDSGEQSFGHGVSRMERTEKAAPCACNGPDYLDVIAVHPSDDDVFSLRDRHISPCLLLAKRRQQERDFITKTSFQISRELLQSILDGVCTLLTESPAALLQDIMLSAHSEI